MCAHLAQGLRLTVHERLLRQTHISQYEPDLPVIASELNLARRMRFSTSCAPRRLTDSREPSVTAPLVKERKKRYQVVMPLFMWSASLMRMDKNMCNMKQSSAKSL